MKKSNWYSLTLATCLLLISTFIGVDLISNRDALTNNFGDLLFLITTVLIGVVTSITLLLLEIKSISSSSKNIDNDLYEGTGND
jgi:hypothetical protein